MRRDAASAPTASAELSAAGAGQAASSCGSSGRAVDRVAWSPVVQSVIWFASAELRQPGRAGFALDRPRSACRRRSRSTASPNVAGSSSVGHSRTSLGDPFVDRLAGDVADVEAERLGLVRLPALGLPGVGGQPRVERHEARRSARSRTRCASTSAELMPGGGSMSGREHAEGVDADRHLAAVGVEHEDRVAASATMFCAPAQLEVAVKRFVSSTRLEHRLDALLGQRALDERRAAPARGTRAVCAPCMITRPSPSMTKLGRLVTVNSSGTKPPGRLDDEDRLVAGRVLDRRPPELGGGRRCAAGRRLARAGEPPVRHRRTRTSSTTKSPGGSFHGAP